MTECREKFDSCDMKVFDHSGNKSCKFESESRPAPKRKKHFSEGSTVDALLGMPGVNKFKVSIFYVIIDQLNHALKQRIRSYSSVQQRYGFLIEFDSMSDEDIRIAIERLVDIYSKDLSFELFSVFCQFICWYKKQSKKNTAEKSQQALFNLFSNCCTQMESTLHSQIPK